VKRAFTTGHDKKVLAAIPIVRVLSNGSWALVSRIFFRESDDTTVGGGTLET